jgi:hypothetical protein
MEERIADERNFSAVLGPANKRTGRPVRQHFAILGKALLTAEVKAEVRQRTLCVGVTQSECNAIPRRSRGSHCRRTAEPTCGALWSE